MVPVVFFLSLRCLLFVCSTLFETVSLVKEQSSGGEAKKPSALASECEREEGDHHHHNHQLLLLHRSFSTLNTPRERVQDNQTSDCCCKEGTLCPTTFTPPLLSSKQLKSIVVYHSRDSDRRLITVAAFLVLSFHLTFLLYISEEEDTSSVLREASHVQNVTSHQCAAVGGWCHLSDHQVRLAWLWQEHR